MIYPSLWKSYFDIEIPDMEPYKLVTEYAEVENEVLSNLEEPPLSRPWIQDFDAPWLYKSLGKPTFHYGKEEVEAQIKALYENGDRKSTRLNSSHVAISYAVFCLQKKTSSEVSISHR